MIFTGVSSYRARRSLTLYNWRGDNFSEAKPTWAGGLVVVCYLLYSCLIIDAGSTASLSQLHWRHNVYRVLRKCFNFSSKTCNPKHIGLFTKQKLIFGSDLSLKENPSTLLVSRFTCLNLIFLFHDINFKNLLKLFLSQYV